MRAVAGASPTVFEFDDRRLSESATLPLERVATARFCPSSLRGSHEHITGIKYNWCGSELLASFNDDDAFVFDRSAHAMTDDETAESSTAAPPDDDADPPKWASCLRLVDSRRSPAEPAEKKLMRRSPAEKKLLRERRSIRFFVLFLIYPMLCNRSFGYFNCRRLGENTSLLIDDYAVDCNSSSSELF